MRSFLLFLVLFYSSLCLAINPVKEYVDHPGNFNFRYEENQLRTSDGYMLNSWLCFPDNKNDNNTVLVVAYGDGGNMSFLLRQTNELVGKGFTVLLFDYRGFGESQAFEIDSKQLYYEEFTLDLNTALEFASSRFKSAKIGLWTLSMGSIMGTLTSTSNLFEFMVSEGFVTDPNRIVEKLVTHTKEIYTVPESASEYTRVLGKLNVPVLLFAGDRDGLTTVEDSERVKFLNPKNELVLFKGGHLQGFQALSGSSHGEKYIQSIQSFVEGL